MAYGYPYQMQQPVIPSYFNTNYAPPMPQMQQTSAANVTWIYVNGWDGARNQIVQPGQTAWMMDNAHLPFPFRASCCLSPRSSTLLLILYADCGTMSIQKQHLTEKKLKKTVDNCI